MLNSKISTYLFSISKNLWLKELRNKKRLETEELSEEKQPQLEENQSNKEELITQMTKAINNLSQNCQKLIKLYYYESKSWSEILPLMNYKNEHAARNQKYKCFKKLKQELR